MTTNRWVVDVERILLRGSTVSPDRLERIMDGVRGRLRSAHLSDAMAAAGSRNIPRIAVRAEGPDEEIARVLADALVRAVRGDGGASDG